MKKNKNSRLNYRVFRCTRCADLMQTNMKGSAAHISDVFENHCVDSTAPGGYRYCNYEELVPKK